MNFYIKSRNKVETKESGAASFYDPKDTFILADNLSIPTKKIKSVTYSDSEIEANTVKFKTITNIVEFTDAELQAEIDKAKRQADFKNRNLRITGDVDIIGLEPTLNNLFTKALGQDSIDTYTINQPTLLPNGKLKDVKCIACICLDMIRESDLYVVEQTDGIIIEAFEGTVHDTDNEGNYLYILPQTSTNANLILQ